MNFRSVVKALIPRRLFTVIEPWGHLVEAVVLNLAAGFPARGLNIIGVTGTNGKTTTAFLIHKMMLSGGYKVGLMTTVAYGVGENIKPQVEHMTTVSVPQLLKRIKQMKAEGAEWLVLETTSHALGQNRVWGIPYSLAVLTNLTHEHLDYHGTFEKYQKAKLKLFKMTAKNRSGLQTGIINADDPTADAFTAAVPKALTYGVHQGQLRATDIKSTSLDSSFTVRSETDDSLKLAVKINLPGSFNVYNALAAVGVGLALQIEGSRIENGIASLSGVEGRMTTIDEGQDFDVIVDFAHTPDSFEKLFSDLRPIIKGKMIVMFGSAGRRDEAKRSIQGRIAGKYADEIIVTEEDDRDVDGVEIMQQIAAGAESTGKERDKNLFLVHDRTKAIEFAIKRAGWGDTVLLLGKGHEKTIERSHGEDPWDEIEIAKQALRDLGTGG